MDFSDDIETSTFAENLRTYRDRMFPGWGGLGRFAKAAGVSPDALSRWMSGKQIPTMARLNALAKALGVEVGDLYGRQKTENSGDSPDIVQGQIAVIDTLLLVLTYNKRMLLGEADATRHKEGFRIIRELLRSELE
jgi:transcriptional regulator with XRE-family HTH domain